MFAIVSRTEVNMLSENSANDRKEDLDADKIWRHEDDKGSLMGSENLHAFDVCPLNRIESFPCLLEKPIPSDEKFSLDQTYSGDISLLEEELQAELERMELNINPALDLEQHNFIGISDKVEPDNATLGELTVPLEVEQVSEKDGSHSTGGVGMHLNDCGVSPWQLEKRLYEVLGAMHEERIAEMEAQLEEMNKKLQAKEEELHRWIEKFKHLSSMRGDRVECSAENLREMPTNEPAEICTAGRGSSYIGYELEGDALSGYNDDDDAFDEFLGVFSGKEKTIETCNGNEDDRNFSSNDYPTLMNDCDSEKDTHDSANEAMIKRSNVGNEEAEQLVSPNLLDFSDETSGSTPCSIKLIDLSISAMCKSGTHTHPFISSPCDMRHLLPVYNNKPAGVNSPIVSSNTEMPITQGVSSKCSLRKQRESVDIFAESSGFYPVFSDYEEDCSDSDEEKGEMLIKRIVERSRKGSPIFKEVSTVLASLESDESSSCIISYDSVKRSNAVLF